MSKKMRHRVQYKNGKKWVIAGAVGGCLALTFDGSTAQASDDGEARAKAAVVANSSVTPTSAVLLSGQSDGGTDDAKVPVEVPPAVAEPVDLTIQNTEKPVVPQSNEPVSTDTSSQTSGTFSSETAERPTAPAESTVSTENVAERPIRPDHAKGTTAMGASHAVPAVALVQTEVTKPMTVAVATAPVISDIDQWMPNKRLQEVMLLALQSFRLENLSNVTKNWQSVADITKEDLGLLSEVIAVNYRKDTYIDGHTTYSLEGLQYAVNLEKLILRTSTDNFSHHTYGDIVDITPLAHLQKLNEVDLTGNRIEDVTSLANLKNITILDLTSNYIRDFSPLKDLELSQNYWTNQLVMLDPIIVDVAKREYHMQVQCINRNGEVLDLWANDDDEVSPLVYTEGNELRYRIHFTGGVAKSDGHGGLYYTRIRDQKEGAKTYPWPEENTVECFKTIEPEPYKYYLTGIYGNGDATVLQPYTLSYTAGPITVHYQDQQGKPVADDATLPQGLVGAPYATQAIDIPGYTLVTTPENATGTYGDTAIDVTYVYTLTEAPGGHQPGSPGTPGNSGNTSNPGNPGNPGTPDVSQPDTGSDHAGGNNTATPTPPDVPSTSAQSGTSETAEGEQPTVSPELIVSDTDDTAVPPTQLTDGQPAQLATTVYPVEESTSTTRAKRTLPQTNERSASSLWGLALLTGLLGWVNIRKRRE